MMESHSELEWARQLRVKGAERRKLAAQRANVAKPVVAKSKADLAAYQRDRRRRLRSEGFLSPTRLDDSAPYPRGFEMNRQAFASVFRAFWGSLV